MNYTTAPTGAAALTYPLKQVTVNIPSIDVGKLHSVPYQLLPSGFNYQVINTTLSYSCRLVDILQNYFIGYETLLNINTGSAFNEIDTTLFIGTTSYIGLDSKNKNLYLGTSVHSQPLVIWQQADNAGADYVYFIITITYLQFP